MFHNDYIRGHWISHSEQVTKLLTQERTHDPVSCAGGWGVRSGDKWWSAGVASVEAGHGRKTGVDVWRDWVCRVILEDEKQKRSIFSLREKEGADLCSEFYILLWRLPGCGEAKVTVWGVGRQAASAGSLWCPASWRQPGSRTRPDQKLTQRGSAESSLIIIRQQLKKPSAWTERVVGWQRV